jgi:hypothetical protein
VAFAADNSVTLTAPSAVTVAFNSTSLALSYTWTADLNASIQCTMRRFFNTTANGNFFLSLRPFQKKRKKKKRGRQERKLTT